MTEDDGIRVVDLQGAEQGNERCLLGRSACVGRSALFVKASFVADTNRVGIVATGMSSYHFFWTARMELAVLGDVVVVAGGFEASSLMTGFEVF